MSDTLRRIAEKPFGEQIRMRNKVSFYKKNLLHIMIITL